MSRPINDVQYTQNQYDRTSNSYTVDVKSKTGVTLYTKTLADPSSVQYSLYAKHKAESEVYLDLFKKGIEISSPSEPVQAGDTGRFTISVDTKVKGISFFLIGYFFKSIFARMGLFK